ncbi:hypothetical protein SCHPADRAFT_100166 [Schizopora paradoxa]|uniref:Uncharacterized protein n=1 Tax=Schizopora paradoxa TaxID=27342 RepID=A0A0H2SAP1_9AGAM|nr:hypothetical protein SCHPADRAFT_100166 [Schizopora paradoxa]
MADVANINADEGFVTLIVEAEGRLDQLTLTFGEFTKSVTNSEDTVEDVVLVDRLDSDRLLIVEEFIRRCDGHCVFRGKSIHLRHSEPQYFSNFFRKWRNVINLPVWLTTLPFSGQQSSPGQTPETLADYVINLVEGK